MIFSEQAVSAYCIDPLPRVVRVVCLLVTKLVHFTERAAAHKSDPTELLVPQLRFNMSPVAVIRQGYAHEATLSAGFCGIL